MDKGAREDLPKTRKFVGTTDLFGILIMAMVSWVYKCVNNSQIILFKFMQFMVCQLYLNKAIAKRVGKNIANKRKGTKGDIGSKV